MELIRKTRTEINKNGNKIRYAIFKCPFCLQEVERCISNGLKQKSCGCIKLEKMEHHRYGKHNTNEARQKMSLSQKKRFLNLENHPMYVFYLYGILNFYFYFFLNVSFHT